MSSERFWATAAVMAVTATLYGQVPTGATANVNADGGYVALQNGTRPWQGMTSVAANATITLDPSAGEGEGGGGSEDLASNQFKFNKASGTPTPTTYSDSTTGAGGTSSTSGASNVTDSATAPTYYSAGWSGTATSPPTSPTGQLSGTGTYDPWSITYASLYALGANPGDTVDLYYQSGLFQTGIYGPTGAFSGGSNSVAYYNFQAYAQTPSSFPAFVSIYYTAGFSPQAFLGNNGEFDIYLLGANANDPNASPSDRTGAPDAQSLNGNNIQSVLSPYFGANGTLTRDLNFGFVRHFLVPSVPTNGSQDDVLFEWHTDTFAGSGVNAVPEPASIAVLALGTLAMRRRRR